MGGKMLGRHLADVTLLLFVICTTISAVKAVPTERNLINNSPSSTRRPTMFNLSAFLRSKTPESPKIIEIQNDPIQLHELDVLNNNYQIRPRALIQMDIDNSIDYRASPMVSPTSANCDDTCEYRDSLNNCRKNVRCLEVKAEEEGTGKVGASIIKTMKCPVCHRSDFSGKCRLLMSCNLAARGKRGGRRNGRIRRVSRFSGKTLF